MSVAKGRLAARDSEGSGIALHSAWQWQRRIQVANEKTYSYPGKRATVKWNRPTCIHIGECGRASGELFVGGRKPWCQPDQADDDEVEEVVLRCPTGALTVEFADGSRQERADTVNTIQVAYNGPLFVRGDLDIEGAPDDVPGLKFRAALCRCGKSGNKPFCDNSHEDAGFRDYGAVGQTGDPAAGAGGTLHIRPVRNGPLVLRGNVTLRAGAGRKSWQGEKAVLCRCGASRNKPFCDNQHKEIGFRSDDD